ncbi:glycosyltransferase family 4 protein [Larkinella rosea]|uniref:Glycosyltransferase family 1 protein n=1 Tax=Larkinella rosea TaxID=2025312 RepID=A0A3P1BT28_9BACT|nr:glycosyltransferase family 4 protein [Larkinella rosea]RRB04261.1 glycosyltransferase family 1 protein [Larkinella rosea]
MNMKVTQLAIGRFHHFHLARQLERLGLLEKIYTGFPKFKLRDEQGIPKDKVKTFPWIHTPYMKRGLIGIDYWKWLSEEWEWLDMQVIDKYVAGKINHPTILIALSGNGLHAGKKAKDHNGYFICDRGSSHIRFQDQILREEFSRWGHTFRGIDSRVIEKEEIEYEQSDLITVPSQFVKKTFLDQGIPEEKLAKIPYGARLERFYKVAEPSTKKFKVLWVGSVGIRKGFMYALQAFQNLKHPNKEFVVIGTVEPEMRQLLAGQNLDKVSFLGLVPNAQLPRIYSTAHVFVIPSLEEGLAMVQGEALACGCPVIASVNSGAEDLFEDGKEGFILPIRNPAMITNRLEQFADDPELRQKMSVAAIERVKSIGGWDSYGNGFQETLLSLIQGY